MCFVKISVFNMLQFEFFRTSVSAGLFPFSFPLVCTLARYWLPYYGCPPFLLWKHNFLKTCLFENIPNWKHIFLKTCIFENLPFGNLPFLLFSSASTGFTSISSPMTSTFRLSPFLSKFLNLVRFEYHVLTHCLKHIQCFDSVFLKIRLLLLGFQHQLYFFSFEIEVPKHLAFLIPGQFPE